MGSRGPRTDTSTFSSSSSAACTGANRGSSWRGADGDARDFLGEWPAAFERADAPAQLAAFLQRHEGTAGVRQVGGGRHGGLPPVTLRANRLTRDVDERPLLRLSEHR